MCVVSVDSGDDPLVSRPPPAQQEYAAPGRLPEVPLRMARREQEEEQEEAPDQTGTQSSYSVSRSWEWHGHDDANMLLPLWQ